MGEGFHGKTTGNTNGKSFDGHSTAIRKVYAAIEKYAATDTPILITGKTGTGKEVCAEMLHHYSGKTLTPFITINCAAIPEQLLESSFFGHIKGAFTGADRDQLGAVDIAQSGTLFLDEIAESSPHLQAKLLRFCQDYNYAPVGSHKVKKANVRLIYATNKDLPNLIQNGKFREDLYYRLNSVTINIPSLTDRRVDIPDIAHKFLETYNAAYEKNIKGISDNALQLLCHYEWPGNVRELENIIKNIVATENCNYILSAMLPNTITSENQAYSSPRTKANLTNHHAPLWKIEKRAIENAIALSGGNVTKAAKALEIAPSTIYRKMNTWDEK